tara:strand:- start:650 stop:1138 length:489 start_codon:yes stop_codon:yes gene_type:complete
LYANIEWTAIHQNPPSVKQVLLYRQSGQTITSVDYDRAKSFQLSNLFGTASKIFSSGNAIDPITSDFVTEQINSDNMGINSSITLFQGNQLNNQIAQNKLLMEKSIFQEEIEKNNIALNILETYLQALYSKENISIAENKLAASEQEVSQSNPNQRPTRHRL